MTSSSSRPRNVPPPPGSAGARAALYARFIPREELSSFAAWQPNDLSGASPAGSVSTAATVGEAPGGVSADVLAEQVQSARQSGYHDGYRDGLVALDGFKQSFAHQTTVQIGALVQAIGGQLDSLQQEMALALAQAATSLARQIVRSELQARPESIASVAHEALDTLLLSARHITLRVHLDDHPFVADGAGEALAARGARLVADPSVSRGGCVVESNIGCIDASVEARWRRAAAALGSDEPWNAGEPEATA